MRDKGLVFERKVQEYLSSKGYWVTKLHEGVNGAPFDLLAIRRDEEALAVECKVCGSMRFPLNRVEDNQWAAMRKFQQKGGRAVFAMLFSPFGFVYIHEFSDIYHRHRCGDSSVPVQSKEMWLM